MNDPRSQIPSVDALVVSDAFALLVGRFTRPRVVDATRAVVEAVRARIAVGEFSDDPAEPEGYAREVESRLVAAEVASLRRVVNATGVVLHTNLGRAPLATEAAQAMLAAATEYSNLEYDLDSGGRGSRYVHCVALLKELIGGDDALVVNNAAGALVLAMNTLALGRGVAVSRGELVEIGGGFRIPEVLERAGARLVEVGSTNRTRLADYREALEEQGVEALLKVHRSNFRISGFTEEATLTELVGLAAERGLTLVHDLGSGLMLQPDRVGLPEEPRASDSIAAGVSVVVVSGDKLLGGPQAGIIVGRADLIATMRKNPLCRALRVDKVTLAGLEATLRLYRDPDRAIAEIPTLRMLSADPAELRDRAETLATRLGERGVACSVTPSKGAVGGGTFPGTDLDSWAVELASGGRPDDLADRLRAGTPPVIARIVDDALLLDMRTVLPGQEGVLAACVSEAAERPRPTS